MYDVELPVPQAQNFFEPMESVVEEQLLPTQPQMVSVVVQRNSSML